MENRITMWRFSVLLLLLMAAGNVFAQNVVFSANASAEKIGTEDHVQISYTIQNLQNLEGLDLAPALLKNFSLVQGPFQQQSTQVSISGNRMVRTSSVTYTYVFQPKKVGRFTVPPAVAKAAGGQTYRSNELVIEVVPGSLRQQQRHRQDPFGDTWAQDPFADMLRRQRQRALGNQHRQQQEAQEEPADTDISDDLFIRVSVDKQKVHVGEQITASYKLYARIPMNVSISKLPSLNGFWTQDFDIPRTNIRPTEETIGGKRYQVFLLKKSALFPQQTGTLELDPAEATGTARILQKTKRKNPFASLFDDPFANSLMMNDPFFNDDFFNSVSYRDINVSLRSKPVKITVLPLPEENRPDHYGGAVGQFTISSNIDKTDLTTDELANLTLTIKGSGNLKLIEAPVLNLPNGLSTYDPHILDSVTGRTSTIKGYKVITYAITPGTPGSFNIPAIPFTYFNPESDQYVTLSTNPLKLNVKPGKSYTAGRGNNIALTDIHTINTAPLGAVSFNSRPLFLRAGYWSMYALPLLAFIGFAVWRRREDELSKDVVKLRNRRANRIALKRLSTAKKLLLEQSRVPFYEEISKAIWLYLSDKLNIPLSALSHEAAADAMTVRNVPAALQERVSAVTKECEAALYAPAGGSQQMNQVYEDAIEIISKLEEAFNL